jgi:hypothetical protein
MRAGLEKKALILRVRPALRSEATRRRCASDHHADQDDDGNNLNPAAVRHGFSSVRLSTFCTVFVFEHLSNRCARHGLVKKIKHLKVNFLFDAL